MEKKEIAQLVCDRLNKLKSLDSGVHSKILATRIDAGNSIPNSTFIVRKTDRFTYDIGIIGLLNSLLELPPECRIGVDYESLDSKVVDISGNK